MFEFTTSPAKEEFYEFDDPKHRDFKNLISIPLPYSKYQGCFAYVSNQTKHHDYIPEINNCGCGYMAEMN